MPRAPGLPGEFVAVYGPTGLAVFAVAGLAIAPAGALDPRLGGPRSSRHRPARRVGS